MATTVLAAPAVTMTDLKERLALLERGCATLATAAKQSLATGPALERPRAVLADHLCRAERFCWALQRYPLLDTKIIQMTKRVTATWTTRVWKDNRQVDEPQTGEVDVPVFGMVAVQNGFPQGTCKVGRFGGLYFGGDAWHPKDRDARNPYGFPPDVTLESEPNAIPEFVQARTRAVQAQFDGVTVLYEAEWKMTQAPPAKDPLVIGHLSLGGGIFSFVIDAYDQTKIETYIQREFTA